MENPLLWTICQTLLNGIVLGGIYCLISVGLTVIVGVMKVVNFSQGECLTVGMYITYVLQILTGWDPLILLVPVMIIMFLFGMGVFEMVIRPVVNRDKTVFTVVTMGLAYVLSTGLMLIFSANPLPVDSAFKTTTLTLGSFSVAMPRAQSFVLMIAFIVALNLFLKKTDMGRAMRATAENKEVSQMLGINTKTISRFAYGLGIMFAGVAGLLLTPTYYLYPTIGNSFKIMAMVCVVIGGLGNIGGAVVGGLLIGVVEAFLGTFVSVDLAPAGSFVLLLLVLIFLPNGLFGKGERVA